VLKALRQYFKITYPLPALPETLTLLTAGTQVAGAVAVTDVTVPAFFAVSTVGTCVSGTPHVSLSGAETADTCGRLSLRQPPQVAALPVNEEVPHAAHEAKAEGSRPHFRGDDEGLAIFR